MKELPMITMPPKSAQARFIAYKKFLILPSSFKLAMWQKYNAATENVLFMPKRVDGLREAGLTLAQSRPPGFDYP